MGRKRKTFERETENKCKQCGKIFVSTKHIKYCPECYTKERKKQTIEFFKKNGNWRIKLKWRQKLVTCTTNTPTKEKWNYTYNPALTTEPCTYCGEPHTEGEIYRHPYMQKVPSLAIEICDIEELAEEIKKRKEKPTKEILEEIGLEKGQILTEELKEEDL